LLPLGLRALKLDPAAISAPFLATFVDVAGLILHFSFASAVLDVYKRGELLPTNGPRQPDRAPSRWFSTPHAVSACCAACSSNSPAA
jgi:hypothetical protein